MNATQSISASACIFCATSCDRTRNNPLCSSAVCAAAVAAQAKIDAGRRKTKTPREVLEELAALALLGLAVLSPLIYG